MVIIRFFNTIVYSTFLMWEKLIGAYIWKQEKYQRHTKKWTHPSAGKVRKYYFLSLKMTTTTAKPDSSSHNSEEFFDIKSENLTLGAPLGRIFGLDSQGQGRAVINVAQDKKSGSQFAVKRFW